jgi:ABC-type multidrug transport system fused ATPase/permease subunit
MHSSSTANRYQPLAILAYRLWTTIGLRRQRQGGQLLALMILSAMLEAVSLGAILPFLTVLAAPQSVMDIAVVRRIADWFGIHSPDDLALPLALAFIFAALLAGVVRLVLLWQSSRFALAVGGELSCALFERTLYKNYEHHISRNSGDVISRILGQVGDAIGFLEGIPVFLSSVVLITIASIALFTISPFVFVLAFLGFGSAYGAIVLVTQKRLRANSYIIAISHANSIKALQDGLGAIREILLDSTQQVFTTIFRRSDLQLRTAQAINGFLAGSPRFLMEASGMVLIAALAYYLSLETGGFMSQLPVLGVMALGAQRILPAMQQCYGSIAQMLGTKAALEAVLQEIQGPVEAPSNKGSVAPLVLSNKIVFKNVSFRYASAHQHAIKNINFTVEKGMRVGIVGKSGSGKSTLVDVLMGLLVPTEGSIEIDGIVIDEDLRLRWRKAVAHVPQSLYVSDTTFTSNIAFGIPSPEISQQQVRLAAEKARIADFIESRPRGFNGIVGERGGQISGGERQRLGIARALYKNASVLIMDEATSAIDSINEKHIMESIDALDRNLTIFLVAHRIQTIRNCDCVLVMDAGELVCIGTHDWLVENCTIFQSLVNITTESII